MSTTTVTIHNDVDEIMPSIVADRRYLHEHPELGFQEHNTAAFVADRLAQLNLTDIRTGVGRTGVTALIEGSASGPRRCLLLRADMDALPIQELNEVEYRSRTDGVMHACGHDGHVAMLLATARLLAERRDSFAGSIKLLFQPAEEGLGGAMAMIEAGALKDPVPDATMGLHIWQHVDLGTVEVRDTVAMVAADGFTITIQGKGGHGARPQSTVDPIAIGATIVNALQNLVSRETNPVQPAVVTVGAFHAGSAANVIPDSATLRGSLRTVTTTQRETLVQRITDTANGVANAMRGSATVSFGGGVPPTVNDPAIAAIVKVAAAEVVGPDNVVEGPLKVVSEDYSEFLARVPGCFFFVGSRNVERGLAWGHHNARFDIDEEALGIGVEVMTRSALRYLGSAGMETAQE